MKYIFLTIFISLSCISFAQQTVKYLPSKVICSEGDTCKFEYDKYNRISVQNKISAKFENISKVESCIYTYLDADKFTCKIKTYLKVNDSIFDLRTEYNKYEKKGSCLIHSKINLSSSEGNYSADTTIYVSNSQIDANGLVTKEYSFDPNEKDNYTTFDYDSLQRINKVKKVTKREMKTEVIDASAKYETSNDIRGIFKDVNFTPITKIVQEKSPLPLIIASLLPSEISVKISESPTKLGKIELSFDIKIEYIINENGYVKSVILKKVNDGKDGPLIYDIEYIKVEN